MGHQSRNKESYLVALLCLLAAAALALLFPQVQHTEAWRELVVHLIPEAIVALLAFPVAYYFLFSRGIRVLSSSEDDREESTQIDVSRPADVALVPPDARTLMQRIPSEMEKASASPQNLMVDVSSDTSALRRSALVVVDIQNDFFGGGALPVKEAESLIEPLNRAIAHAEREGFLIIVTQDWHPENHRSFKGHGGVWPVHCVKATPGAQLHPGLLLPERHEAIRFGTDPNTDGYSPFENPSMAKLLQAPMVGEVFVVGIATEYCVLATCLAAKNLGKSVVVVESLVRAADQTKLESTWASYDNHGIFRISTLPGQANSPPNPLTVGRGRPPAA
jgi:nicotinamidase/pyrazinamidase